MWYIFLYVIIRFVQTFVLSGIAVVIIVVFVGFYKVQKYLMENYHLVGLYPSIGFFVVGIVQLLVPMKTLFIFWIVWLISSELLII